MHQHNGPICTLHQGQATQGRQGSHCVSCRCVPLLLQLLHLLCCCLCACIPVLLTAGCPALPCSITYDLFKGQDEQHENICLSEAIHGQDFELQEEVINPKQFAQVGTQWQGCVHKGRHGARLWWCGARVDTAVVCAAEEAAWTQHVVAQQQE